MIFAFLILLIAVPVICTESIQPASNSRRVLEFVGKTIRQNKAILFERESNVVHIYTPVYLREKEAYTDSIFFAEEGKGIFITFGDKAIWLLDGYSVAGDSKGNIYLASNYGGIYNYNTIDKSVHRFGCLKKPIKSVAVEKGGRTIFALTYDNILYTVIKGGTTCLRDDQVHGTLAFVLDNSDNIYYYDEKYKVYAITSNGHILVHGIPKFTHNNAIFVRPPIEIDAAVFFIVDRMVYLIFKNGTSHDTGLSLDLMPAAMSVDQILVTLFAFKNKIYAFSFLIDLLSDFLIKPPTSVKH